MAHSHIRVFSIVWWSVPRMKALLAYGLDSLLIIVGLHHMSWLLSLSKTISHNGWMLTKREVEIIIIIMNDFI